MKTPLIALSTLALALAGVTRPAQAETFHTCKAFIDTIPSVITSSGVYCLRADLATSSASGNAITINANNVTIDCNGFRLGGLSAGPGTSATGIYADPRANVSVRNCNIRGFYIGIYLFGSGHRVESNRLEGNTNVGIFVAGDASAVVGNTVLDTGGGTVNPTGAEGILTLFRVDIIDNTVDGLSVEEPDVGLPFAVAIHSSNQSGGTIADNRLRGFGSIPGYYGIYVDTASPYADIRNNYIGAGTTTGIRCQSSSSVARDNVIVAGGEAVENCTESGNIVTSP